MWHWYCWQIIKKKAKYVYGIEINESAVKDANYNKKLNNINNIEFLCEDANKIKNNYKNIMSVDFVFLLII